MAQTKESQPEAKRTYQLLVSIGQFAQTWCKPHMSLVIEAKRFSSWKIMVSYRSLSNYHDLILLKLGMQNNMEYNGSSGFIAFFN